MKKKPRQGHTRWRIVYYEAGAFSDVKTDCVLVHRCFANKVTSKLVHYQTNDNDFYLCRYAHWFTYYPTFRAAYRAGQALMLKGEK